MGPHKISQLLINISFTLRLFSEIHYANTQGLAPESRHLVWKSTLTRKGSGSPTAPLGRSSFERVSGGLSVLGGLAEALCRGGFVPV